MYAHRHSQHWILSTTVSVMKEHDISAKLLEWTKWETGCHVCGTFNTVPVQRHSQHWILGAIICVATVHSFWGRWDRHIRWIRRSMHRQHVNDSGFYLDAQNYWNWRVIFEFLSEWLEEQRLHQCKSQSFKIESIKSSFGYTPAINMLSVAVDKICSGHDPS